MAELSPEKGSRLGDRGTAVALITLTRYLAERDPDLLGYLEASLEHARASSLPDADLDVLRLMVGSIGRR